MMFRLPNADNIFVMKKGFILFVFALLLLGCIDIVFKYTLSQTGSMTKAGDVYDGFYDSYIKSGQLLPAPYSLTISTLEGKVIETISGEWNKSQPVTLATGKYHVVGNSKGGASYSNYYSKAVLVFDEDIEITESSTEILLHADYDCFLLLFDAAEKTYFRWSADGTSNSASSGDVPKVGDYYYLFVQEFKQNGYIQWNYGSKENRISMSDFVFKKGCYYYFNDLAGKFEMPKMNPGSI